jgi:hypothetical protein
LQLTVGRVQIVRCMSEALGYSRGRKKLTQYNAETG